MKLSPSLLTLLGMIGSWQSEAVAESNFVRDIRPLFEHFCFDCHGKDKAKGHVNLEQFNVAEDFWRNPKLWQKVLVQLRDQVMPPRKQDQPTEEERALLLEWISATLANPNEKLIARDPGVAGLHRLSRLEYNNTVRDLLGVTSRPADQFPLDSGGGGGFDNNSSTLFLPPVLIQSYLRTAQELLLQAAPERIFTARPDGDLTEPLATRQTIERFATQAFRRPLDEDEISRLIDFHKETRNGGASWEDSIRLTCQAVLVSPAFLFRMEGEQAAAEPYRINNFELASRLSYFLWASMPDEELFRAADQGELTQPEVLSAQVQRMLADPKARDFAENFVSQWLRTKELLTGVQPAPDKFPQFTQAVRQAAYAEPVEFFYALVRDNLPLTDLLDANYTYANDALTQFYEMDLVEGSAMRRVELKDPNRGGVLGMAGILTLTSYPRRTSPVLRGKWVMEEILGTPPPPPPPLVNTSKLENEKSADGLSFRQRLERHRQLSRCAGCHSRMDPLGFGLENFDPIGRWRTTLGDQPVDVSGQLATGEKFTGAAELKILLLKRKDEFLSNVTEKLLAYALGRGIEPCDWLTVHQITKAVAADGYRTQRLILEITRSLPFQYRRPLPAAQLTQAP